MEFMWLQDFIIKSNTIQDIVTIGRGVVNDKRMGKEEYDKINNILDAIDDYNATIKKKIMDENLGEEKKDE